MIDPYTREANYLNDLWAAKDSTRHRRMTILKKLADVVIPHDGEEWDYAALRSAPLPRDMEPWCFVCGETRLTMHQHHVIQLQHGGSNSRRNVVNLCVGCHAEIHPWMDAPTSHAHVRGWTRVGDMLPWLMDRLERLFNQHDKLPGGEQ